MDTKKALKLSASLAILLVACVAFAMAAHAQDLTRSAPPKFIPPQPDYNEGFLPGDMAEIDVKVTGTALDYAAVLLNVGLAAANNLFIKVQNQDGDNMFEWCGCYTGNNDSERAFGLGFFNVTEPFNSAHMQVVRNFSDVTIKFTNVDGGAKADQQYICTGAPIPEGPGIGVAGYGGNAATIDNFSDGTAVLDTFGYTGPLAGSGKWVDIDPGMVADGSVAASVSPTARSVWADLPSLVQVDIRANGQDGPIIVSPSDPVAISISLNPGDLAGVNAELWIVVQWPFGMFWNYYSYQYPTGWLPGINRCIEMPLPALGATNVLTATLPPNQYEFFFAVDDQVDGIPEGTWVDSVKVLVQQPQ